MAVTLSDEQFTALMDTVNVDVSTMAEGQEETEDLAETAEEQDEQVAALKKKIEVEQARREERIALLQAVQATLDADADLYQRIEEVV